MSGQDFFYSGQVRRFLLQFQKMFSFFQVEYGYDDAGNVTYLTVPIRYGDASRNAATILQENSANNVPCSPLFTFYISDMNYDRKNVQDPYFVDRKHIKQRTYNETTETYEQIEGNAFTIERIMPVPYVMELTLDLWTSNTNMKLQLFEQIAPLFNPSLEIQNTDNYLDWTSLSAVELKSNKWTSRSIPAGSDDDIDIYTIKFEMPIWISPPAKVTKQGVIHKIIASIYDDEGDMIDAIQSDDLLLGTRQKITPTGFKILLLDDKLQILEENNPLWVHNRDLEPIEPQLSNVKWHPIIEQYSALIEGISLIRLTAPDGSEIKGTISYDPDDDNYLFFNVDVDSTPANTLSAVDAVINPLKSGPNAGLPDPIGGTRYLLTKDIGSSADNEFALAWSGTANNELIASANDIIIFDGVKWVIEFNASESDAKEYVTNITTNIQYKWDLSAWVKSYAGIYDSGEWAIVI